ncbi:hypothetical protein PFTANZ_06412 [Plasmodium falciparum Tanzania (2000708)]|uniref:Duffy-binding-like domain-containing protein n=1 Tax=Plasmodium falciparum Tanzania (2000708) TaxID=1036725 RepID=A0A024VWQ9_PLAFA|nr:hypothetical protein PFTANZ_06412 [Plasmodium falciparum Tanzania (2000708)]
MFKSNEDVEKGLQVVFGKIYAKLEPEGKNYPDDGSGNYSKLREAWWKVNRDQVWRAITCDAPRDAHYFLKSSPDFKSFSDHKCGHYEGAPPTNLDYVPQFLRWFEEWAEEFCRKKKIKLWKVKEACRGKKGEKYCSHNACDCQQSIIRTRDFVWDSKCVNCSIECHRYEYWINNQLTEFKNQKDKYQSEINRYNSSKEINNNFNDKYYKEFYDKLKVEKYKTVNQFLELLSKENKCKNIDHEDKTYFSNSDDKETFSRSKYCQVCPYCGVDCNGTTCTPKTVIYPDCGNNDKYDPPTDVTPTKINVLYSGDKQGDITEKLKDFCNNSTNYKGENNQKWECYYKHEKMNKCKMEQNTEINEDNTKITSFHNFFDLWVTYLLRDTINWKNDLMNCINNKKMKNCNKTCNDNCTCFQGWINKKEKEWNEIKGLLKNQNGTLQNYYNKLKSHFDNYFFLVINNVNQGEEKWKKLKEDLQKEIDFAKLKTNTGELGDSIKLLLDHENKNAQKCMERNPIESCPKVEPQKSDEKNQPQDTPPNPCVNGQNQKVGKITSVRHVAKEMQKQASVRGDINKLKGNIYLVKFKKGSNTSELKSECEITKEHTNDSRRRRCLRLLLRLLLRRRRNRPGYKGPCEGKDNENKRFSIGENWKTGEKVSSKDHVFLPPRREHMCTSNLEYLEINRSPLNGSDGKLVNNSFLGDVLLAAKFEANFIKKKYNHDNNPKGFMDKATICRAMKYSFADIGDIIKGTDMWDENDGEIKTQNNLVTIFGKIKEELKSTLGDKYANDNDGKHTQLRADWWEANRAKVWEAMTCDLKSGSFPCSDKTTPHEDYVPQRLRWMTEWAEWYCKMQKEAYKELEGKCRECKEKGNNCMHGRNECNTCTKACEEYAKNIKKWEEQWEKIKNKYAQLYKKALERANGGDIKDSTLSKEDKRVVEFLHELQKENGVVSSTPSTKSGNTATSDVYSTAAGYIHQELPNMECKIQKRFCKNPSGNTSSDGKDNDKEYAFRNYPYDHHAKCTCSPESVKPEEEASSPPLPPQSDVCDEVKALLDGKDELDTINSCNKKYDRLWDCKNNIDPKYTGACMPPRRQALCIYNLESINTNSEDDLKKAFVKCAAIETHFLWKHYKIKNPKADNDLNEGIIPEDFIRQMYYTFGDYRDLCMNKNIGNDMSDVESKINDVFSNNEDKLPEGKSPGGLTREEWWKEYAPQIWEGMLCALPGTANFQNKEDYKDPPEDFAKRPQFLRWFTEWGDEFCTERKKLEDKVGTACKSDYEGCKKNKGSDNCVSACNEYKQYIEDKKKQYDKQNEKFEAVKSGGEQEYKDILNDDAPEYLKENCLFGSCSCMDKVKKIKDYWTNPHKTYDTLSLQTKCACPPSPCTIVDAILGNKSSMGYHEGCREKYKKGVFTAWDCRPGIFKDGSDGACMPPRRKRLFLKKLHDLKGDETQVDLRQAFIECAAIETFFSWHEFKKEKEKEIKEKKERDGNSVFLYGHEQIVNDSDHPQNILKTGKIHEEFKLQMFYTLADYRDICLGNKLGNTDDTKNISNTVTSILKNEKNGVKPLTAEIWWGKNAKDIWEGMLCALSYDTETKIKNEGLRKIFTEEIKKNYNYERVTFSGGFNGDTKLADFVTRPQYFRWLEEWGDEFCRKKKMKNDKIENDCRGENVNKHSSGDGEECGNIFTQDYTIVPNLEYPSCAISCRSYKKWISAKNSEYEKQKEKYDKQIKDAKSSSDNISDKNFVGKLQNDYKSVETFLEKVKEGSCPNNIGKDKINFKDTEETFKHAQSCAPCPIFGVERQKGGRSNITDNTCKDKKVITAEHIKKMKESFDEFDMLVIDNTVKNFTGDLNGVCKDVGIFEGVRKDQWSCKYSCGLDICNLNTVKKGINDQKNIQIRALFKRWLENFLEDYNKINEKISHCINNDERSKCINGCKNKCNCLYEWINKKREEWKIVRKRFFNQYNVDHSDIYTVKSFLQQDPFHDDVQKAIKPFEKLDNFQDSDECNDTANSKGADGKKKDVVECFLDKLKKKIDTFNKKNREGMHSNCDSKSNEETHMDDTPDNTEPLPLDSFPPPFCNVPANPCGDKDATNVVGVEVVAEILHQEAKDKMLERSGKKGDNLLKGDINKATFKNGGKPSNLNGVCSITKEYTNDTRGSTNGGPCKGKDNDNNGERMKIGTIWQTKDDLQIKDPYLFLPPRREHICTSNLEKIDVKNVTGNGNVNDSFLWDVLLAAKMDAEKIKDLYKNQNKKSISIDENDKETICRAMKYSFADLGDIIKGTDLWGHKDFNDLETKLVTIFEKIKGELGDKYASEDKPYTQLRADWWEANRDQIWNAMKCQTTIPPVTTSCDTTTVTPLVDYIPQRLRWMTEWAEWYCKIQKKAYKTLQKGCGDCMSGKCKNADIKCTNCTESCNKYIREIELWRQQWDTISKKYNALYTKATSSSLTITDDPKDEKDVVDFLKKLYQQNKENNNIYSTAAGYVHQELPNMDCQKQTLFCGTDSDTNYAFKDKPQDYVAACDCNKSTEKKNACTIATNLVKNNDGKAKINGCGPKTVGTYPDWDCKNKYVNRNHTGACMPPRRQKLCVSGLTQGGEITKREDILTKFINCAAIETHFAWERYKNKNKRADDQLKGGIIPEGFKRQMYYTFGDFRDIFFGTDISSCTYIKRTSNAIKSILGDKTTTKEGEKHIDDNKKLQEWWETNGPLIWHGMLCALTNSMKQSEKTKIFDEYSYENLNQTKEGITPLEKFAERPQFLRWMIEWSEHFCKEQKEAYGKLVEGCTGCDVSTDGNCKKIHNECSQCETECKKYKDLITQWKVQWEKQRNKYTELYEKKIRENKDLTDAIERSVIDYFKTLNSNGTTYSTAGKYINAKGYINDCAKSGQNNFDENKNGGSENKYAFKDYPNDHEKQCTCKPKALPPPHVLAQPPPPKKPEARPRAEDQIEHDHRGRSDRGGQRPLPGPRPPPAPAEDRGVGRSATSHDVPPAGPPPPKPKQPTRESVARILLRRTTSQDEDEDEASEEEDDDVDDGSDVEEDEDDDDDDDDDDDEGEEESEPPVTPVPELPGPPAPAAPAPLPPLPSDNTSDILKTTIPFGIALALTSIAFFFMKKKKEKVI